MSICSLTVLFTISFSVSSCIVSLGTCLDVAGPVLSLCNGLLSSFCVKVEHVTVFPCCPLVRMLVSSESGHHFTDVVESSLVFQ